jgi:hypothetical protein
VPSPWPPYAFPLGGSCISGGRRFGIPPEMG